MWFVPVGLQAEAGWLIAKTSGPDVTLAAINLVIFSNYP
jgi:hypothetical protein